MYSRIKLKLDKLSPVSAAQPEYSKGRKQSV